MLLSTRLPQVIVGLAAVVMIGLAAVPATASRVGSMRVAFGDVPGSDVLSFLAAAHRAKARGVDITVNYLQSEDLAAQAVLIGQADIGVGTPYALIQKGNTRLRMFYQLSRLRFYPIVNTEYYQTWKDLDGVTIFVHSPGSGTEAIMNLMAKKHGIHYKSVSYIPGSGVRAEAMLQGRIRATVVDAKRRQWLLEQGGGKFAVLPMPEVHASDEALYASLDFLTSQSHAVNILLEELLKVWREINQNPEAIVTLRTTYQLLPHMPPQDVEGTLPYYREIVAHGTFSNNGGGLEAVHEDFAFYHSAGTITGNPHTLKVEDFWYLAPLNRALDTLGRK